MISGKDFVWGHIGRTGGDTTLHWFKKFALPLIENFNPATSLLKHRSFASRPRWTGNKQRIINLRKLEEWFLSYCVHKRIQVSPEQTYCSYMEDSIRKIIEKEIQINRADQELICFPAPDLIFRQWQLSYDVSNFFQTKGIDVSPKILDLSIAKPTLPYVHEVLHWMSPEQIKTLYLTNPKWRALEFKWMGIP